MCLRQSRICQAVSRDVCALVWGVRASAGRGAVYQVGGASGPRMVTVTGEPEAGASPGVRSRTKAAPRLSVFVAAPLYL